jgi:hypothetical protein
MSWKRLATIPLIIAANGWSWFSYLLSGFPSDKEVYRAHGWGWFHPDMQDHWDDLDQPEVSYFHELKNVGVEYCRAHSQPAMKSLCMFLMIGWIGWVISTLALLLSLFL